MGCQSACYEWADSYDSKVGDYQQFTGAHLTSSRTGSVSVNALHPL
jgi:hypothetical protein